MKRIISFALIMTLVASGFVGEKQAHALSAEIWGQGAYTDVFGDPTEKYYIRNLQQFSGTFNNETVDNAPLSASIVIDNQGMYILLFENGTDKIKNYFDKDQYYTIAVKETNGNKFLASGVMLRGDSRIAVAEDDCEVMLRALSNESGQVVFYLERNDQPMINYRFTAQCGNLVNLIAEATSWNLDSLSEHMLPVTIAAGCDHTVILRKDGTVFATGANEVGQCNVSDWTSIVDVAAAGTHIINLDEPGKDIDSCYTLGVKADGTVLSTGNNDYGQCNVSEWRDIVTVAAAYSHAVGLRADGTVVATQYTGDQRGYRGQCEVSDWRNIVDVAAGDYHTVGLRADGTVVAVGLNSCGQCNVSSWTDIVAVTAGEYHTVGLRADGTVVATEYIGGKGGYKGQCEVSDWRDIVAVSAKYCQTIGLCADGTVVAVGSNWSRNLEISDWENIVSVSAGTNYTVGLRADGTAVAVGLNDSGQCDVTNWQDIMELEFPNSELRANMNTNSGSNADLDERLNPCRSVGSTVTFGNYEQDNDASNGKEPIEWIVLDAEEDRSLLISKYALDCQQYNRTITDVTWETCALRNWLNDSFLNAAFSTDEQVMIPTVSVSADNNPSYKTSPGNSTNDQVFLLSIQEVNRYFSSSEARKCTPTDYAIAQGAYTSAADSVGDKAACGWWLRSPGLNSHYAARVSSAGSVIASGMLFNQSSVAVRPALWINLT